MKKPQCTKLAQVQQNTLLLTQHWSYWCQAFLSGSETEVILEAGVLYWWFCIRGNNIKGPCKEPAWVLASLWHRVNWESG